MHQLAAQRSGIKSFGQVVGKPGEHALADRHAIALARGEVESFLFRNLQKLPEKRANLTRALGVDPESATGVEAIVRLLGVSPRAHREEEVALVLLAQHIVPRILHLTRHAAEQKAATLRQRGHQRDRADAAAGIRLQQHARVARMNGKAQHAASDLRDPSAWLQRAQICQQGFGPGQRLGLRLLQPRESENIVDPAGLQRQYDLGKIEAPDFRQLLRRPLGMLPLGPESDADAGRRAPGAPRALVGGGDRDLLDEQGVDTAVGVEARHAGQTGIDHDRDAVDREGRFGDVGRDDDLPRVVARHRAVLRLGRQLSVQWHDDKAPQFALGLERLDGPADLVGPGHEHEHIPRRRGSDARALPRGHLPDGLAVEIHRPRKVLNAYGKAAALRDQHVAGREVVAQGSRIERGRHHRDLQIGTRALLDLQGAREGDIPVEMALVKLVEDDRRHAAQRRVEGHLPEENALRDETDAGRLGHARLETYLITHDIAERHPDLLRDPPGQHAGGETARLQDDHLAAIEQSVAKHHLRKLGRLARSGRRLHHHSPGALERADEGGLEFVDGKIARGHGVSERWSVATRPADASPWLVRLTRGVRETSWIPEVPRKLFTSYSPYR